MATYTLEARFESLSVHDENAEDQKPMVSRPVHSIPLELSVQIPVVGQTCRDLPRA